MNIFISYSHEDHGYATLIEQQLARAGHTVWQDSKKVRAGDNILTKINEGMKAADALIVIVSKNSLNSKWVMNEFSALAFGDISNNRRRIIPVLIDNSSIPSYLSNYLYLDFSTSVDSGLQRLLAALDTESTVKDRDPPYRLKKKFETNERQIESLGRALQAGRLTLVCGAGASVGAGIPTWHQLLLRLLESMMKKISNDHSFSLDNDTANEFANRYAPSSLIVGKYLKNNLGNDFLKEVRDALYSSQTTSCSTIEEIVNLSRPQRNGKPLDSIITFNFDGLIEENLHANNISYKAIYNEGMKNSPNELPVYHVHGYLPRSGRLPADANIVFSEDSYHSQFIEPFSWSNLIQLNKLSQNTCLFLGLSLTDPNLRRLLDVSNRKNPDKSLNHYIIKKLPADIESNEILDELAIFLEEQDANELGLNVIWIEDFEQIPQVLKGIYNNLP